MGTPQGDDEKKTQVQDYFSRTAESYVTSQTHRSGEDLQRLVEVGEWEAQQQALDIATGGGHTALALAPYVAQVIVTDLTPRMLETARAFLTEQGVTNAHFQIADAEQLPFPADSFDRVTCRVAAHHFPNVEQSVQEVARVLKPGGLFLLIDSIAPSSSELDVFDNTFEKWRDSSHGRSWTLEEWQHFFAQAGLQVEYTQAFRRLLQYDDWTARAQMPPNEKASLERFMLESNSATQRYFEVSIGPDGHLESFKIDFILLKGRKTRG